MAKFPQVVSTILCSETFRIWSRTHRQQPENRMPSTANRWQRHKMLSKTNPLNSHSICNNSMLPYKALTLTEQTINHWQKTLPRLGWFFSSWSWICAVATLETSTWALPWLAMVDCYWCLVVLLSPYHQAFSPQLGHITQPTTHQYPQKQSSVPIHLITADESSLQVDSGPQLVHSVWHSAAAGY